MPKEAAKNHEVSDLAPEDQLRLLWDRYGNLAYWVLAAAALFIIARGGWNFMNAQKEAAIRKDYQACTTPDSYLAFAAKHPGHPLAGVAEESVADNAYSSGSFTDALKSYSEAVSDLPAGPARQQAKLGQAMALVSVGRTGEAEADLKALMADASDLKTVRCEAGYHLANLEIAAGRAGEVQGISEELDKIDATNPFAIQASTLAAKGVSQPGLSAPSISLGTP
ncbi:MAG TPA: hypothetical protein VGG34_08905 [Opitutaceae bacterium]|jgi:hypothetical protein